MAWQRLRVSVFRMLDFRERDTALERGVSFFLLVLIAANLVAVIVGTVEPTYQAHQTLLSAFELPSVGVLAFALPAAILAGGFTRELARRRSGAPRHCPHCGRRIHGDDA